MLIGRFLTPHYTQSHLLRFLRARGWNIKAAAAMLLNDIEWRKEVGADSILETYPQSKYYQLLTGRELCRRLHAMCSPVMLQIIGLA